MTAAANLDQSLAVERPVHVADGLGGVRTGWEEAFRTLARFQYLRGSETVLAGRLQGRLTVVATIRAHGAARDVTTEYRLRDLRRGTIWNVRSIMPSDDSRWIELTCESGVAT